MREQVSAAGMVLKASPVGEYDRRLVILTREFGKITAFARGARRPGNSLMAVSNPFVFGKFLLYEGRDAYTLAGAEVKNYFIEIAGDVEAACYGSYFLEFADYYGREGLEAEETLKLLYQSMRALLSEKLPNRLVKAVFELKLMEINGEYFEELSGNLDPSTRYAWEFVLASPVEKLYTFALSDQVLLEFSRCVEENKRRFVDKTFHSLDILQVLVDN
jgi:DNA repair protein RecO (recombination protein O)